MKDLINFIKKFFSLLFRGKFKALFIEPTDDGFMQFFRYIFVGGASFVTDYALLHLITEVGVYYLISGVISFLAGLWVNYALSKLLVFQKKTSGAEKAKEMFVFAVVAVTGQHRAKGAYAAAQPGLAAVVFKAHYHAAAGVRAALELIVPDHPGL